MSDSAPGGPVYVATFNAVSVSAAQDLFEITAPSTSRVIIRDVRVGQYSLTTVESLSILIIRGYTTTGSGGSTVTPVNVRGISGSPSAGSVVKINNTTVASGGSPLTLLSDVFAESYGWRLWPLSRVERLVVEVSQRLVVRITAPAAARTMNGTMIFQEIGKVGV